MPDIRPLPRRPLRHGPGRGDVRRGRPSLRCHRFPHFRIKLYNASPYNIIRLELNREEADDTPESNRYTRAARFLKEWLRSGVLREDPHPAYYLYSQTFEVEGQTYTRKGFLARSPARAVRIGKIFSP